MLKSERPRISEVDVRSAGIRAKGSRWAERRSGCRRRRGPTRGNRTKPSESANIEDGESVTGVQLAACQVGRIDDGKAGKESRHRRCDGVGRGRTGGKRQ